MRMSNPFQACPEDYGILTMAQEEKMRSMFAHLTDFVVLAEDPREVEPDRVKGIDVMRIFVGGNPVHSKA